MALFSFGRKIEIAKEYSLGEIPVFSTLNPAEQRIVEKKARMLEFKRGDIVYHEGTPSDAFYVVISGQFRLFIKSRTDLKGDTLVYFYRGDHFGEASLLSNRPHSGSVEAERDGIILRFEKEDFLKLMSDIPALALYLSRSLGHRLSRNFDASHRREVKIASLYSRVGAKNILQFWVDFSSRLAMETKRRVVLVDFVNPADAYWRELIHRDPAAASLDLLNTDPSKESELNRVVVDTQSGFHFLHVNLPSQGDIDEKKINALITFLTYRYDYLMIRLPIEINQIAFKTLRQSDRVYLYSEADPTNLSQSAEMIKDLQETFGFGINDIKTILPAHSKNDAVEYAEREAILRSKIFGQLPVKADNAQRYETTIRFMAKEMAGTLLGLALGSGAAYGLAHIGVLRVLEQEGIHIDVIAGCSIGALVGGFWAAGYSADELEKIASSIDRKSGFFKLLGFHDVSIAHKGFFKGNQVLKFFENYLGDKTFQDLLIPTKIIAADLFTSEEYIFESGRVADAIRASSSIPGIFRPFLYQGKYLIDGGVVDPMPVRVLTKMGVKKIIAVNVLSGPKDRIERNRIREEIKKRQKEELAQRNFWVRTLAQTADKVYGRYAVNIFNVIMSTIQFMEYEMAELWGSQADVVIHPIVQEAHWAEFYSPQKFIKIGEERTREQIVDIKALMVS